MSRLANPRFMFVYPFIFATFFLANTTEASYRAGALLVALGELIRLWANGYVGHVKIRHLITAGPYGYARNPLYVGSLLIGLGVCVVVGRVWFAALALGVLLFVYRRQMIMEEEILRREWGASFDRYCREVPRWGFTWRSYSRPNGRWSMEGIAASKEWKTLIWVTVILIALYFREELWQERESFFSEDFVKHSVLLGLAVVLLMIDGVFEIRKRLHRHA